MTFNNKKVSLILDHINNFQAVFDQLFEMSVNFDDKIQGLQFLNTLLDSLKTLNISLKNSASGDKILYMKFSKSGV